MTKPLIPTKNLIIIAALFAVGFSFGGCKASYPKDNVAGSIEKLLKKEYKIDGRAKLEGETLSLDVNLEGLISAEQKVLSQILKKVQGASLVITRVSLSSDAKIKFMILNVSEPSYKLRLRIIQKLDDIKAFLYLKISKEDYEDRLVLEIENDKQDKSRLGGGTKSDGQIDMKEFVGRLIVSQVNMMTRSNPFLAVTLGNTQLKYMDFKEDELVVEMTNSISDPVRPFFETIISSQSAKIIRKYKGWGPKQIRLIDGNNHAILIDVTSNIIPR